MKWLAGVLATLALIWRLGACTPADDDELVQRFRRYEGL